jgi:Protein of unknown function (DUF4256)
MAKKAIAKNYEDLLNVLSKRFAAHHNRHKGLSWDDVEKRLVKRPELLEALDAMEATGGEPDVVGYDKKSDAYIFMDCSPESPKDRRSLCYDDEALASRKEHKPKGSALGWARDIGVQLLSEADFHFLQQLGEFDTKTSSWLDTPKEVRKLGGAIFGDRRFGRVFIYHNGAESYYAARGFRVVLRV